MRPQPVAPKIDEKQKELFNQEYDRIMGGSDTFPANSRLDNDSGSYLTGPRKPSIGDMIQSQDQWSQDPYSYGKPFSYGSIDRNLDFDNYYSRPQFKKLGYVPHRDNDAVYNENTSWVSDFGRAIPQIIKLAGIGFRDMETEWVDFGGKPDVKHAAEMQRAIQMGSTTRGGLGGWVQNFAVNTGYTMGVMTALVAEELALLGITVAAGGTDLPATAPLAVARGTLAATKIGSFAKATRAWAEAFKVIRTPEQASALYNAAKATGKFLNPLERTLEFAGEFNKLNGMKNYAKASRGAMALFGDIRMSNAVFSESKLEGGFAKNDAVKELTDLFYFGNGTAKHPAHNRLPNEEEAKHINELADQNANHATMSNIPLIYLTNKVVFDGAMKGFRTLRESPIKLATEEVAGKLGKVISGGKLVGKYSVAGAREIFKPGNLLRGTLKYTSKNLMEGLQESSQDIIHNTLSDYYKQMYVDPTISTMKASFGRGLLSQVSAQGLDTFIQGFLMGGAIGAVQKPLFTTLPNLGRRIFAPEVHNKWVAEKEAYVNNFLNVYNEIKKNPKKYVDAVNSTDENFVAQSVYNDYISKITNPKSTMDLKDESAFHHVYNMLQNNQFDVLKDLIGDYKKMSPDQLTELFGDSAPDNLNMTPVQRLNNFDKKIDLMKNLWDDHIKTHPNPVSPQEAIKSPEAFEFHQEFEMYRKIALFAHYSFERAADRTASILETANRNKPLSKAFSTDFTPLYSPTDLTDHLRALRQEIYLLKGGTDTESKQDLKSKQNRFDVLSKYKETAIKLQKALKAGDNQLVESLNQELYKSYHEYLTSIADEYNEPLLNSKIDDLFIGIKDFYAVNQDKLDMARAVNMFSNPDHIRELLTRLHGVTAELKSNEVSLAKVGLLTAIDKIKNNALLNELFSKGIYIAENDPFLEGKAKAPSKFYNADQTPITPEKEVEAIEIVKTWLEQTTEVPKPNIVSAQPPPPQELDTELRNAFTLENVRRRADQEPQLHNFDDFVKNNSIALNIIRKHQGVVVPDVVDDSKVADILPGFKGKIVFMTLGVGKSFSAKLHPDEVTDGDDLLQELLISKGITVTSDPQQSGLSLWKYLNQHPDKSDELIKDYQDAARAEANTGKVVLTASKYLRPIVDMAYLSDDVVRIGKVLKDRGQTGGGFAAAKHIEENKVIPAGITTAVEKGQFVEDILTGITPVKLVETMPVVDLTSRLKDADTLTKLKKLEDELIEEVKQNKISSAQARTAVEERKRQLITDVSFDRIKKGDILIMTDTEIFGDKGYGQVIVTSPEEIRVRRWWAGMKPGTATVGKTVTPGTLKQEVSLIYDNAMTDEDITPSIDPASETVAKDDVTEEDQNIQDELNQMRNKNNPKTNTDDLDDNCKT